jgi:hypothetical protein
MILFFICAAPWVNVIVPGKKSDRWGCIFKNVNVLPLLTQQQHNITTSQHHNNSAPRAMIPGQ